MRKSLFTIVCFFVAFNAFAFETKWKITEETELYKISWDGINYEKTGVTLKPETEVTGLNSTIYKNKSTNIEMVKIQYNGKYYIDVNSVKLLDSEIVFDDYLLSKNLKEKNLYIISTSYFDALKQHDRNYLCVLEKKGFENYEKNKSDMDYEWYESRSYFNKNKINAISLSFVNVFSSYDLMIQDIKKINNGYLVKSEVTFSKDYENKKFNIPKAGDVIELNLRVDGDYIYVEYQDDILGTYVITDKQTSDEIDNFIKKNNCNYSKITWPRHTDGTCDYDRTNKSTAKTSLPTTNVSVNKTMSVKENLKLRSAEAASSNVLTVMSAGTKVKILKLGKAENIDGIKSNWVKVEVISGNDRDCNKLKSGMTGWCYGGYLE